MQNKLCFSILKNNKLFSAALILIYTLVTAILVMLTFFYPSISETFNTYISEYQVAEATVLTKGTPREMKNSIAQLDGVKNVSQKTTIEKQALLPNGKTLSLRFQSIPHDDGSLYYNVIDKKNTFVNSESVMISSYFANANDIQCGSVIRVKNGDIEVSLTVTDIISCPETICVARNGTSWYDNSDYAFVYLSEGLMDSTFGCGSFSNRFDIWFEDGTDQRKALESITDFLGDNVALASLFEDSLVYQQLRSALDGTKAIVTDLPVLIAVMGVFFSALFIRQIIYNSQKSIGLLRSLGYSSAGIRRIFVRYNLILTLVASIIGSAMGVVLLRQMLLIYKDFYDLPYIKYSRNAVAVVLLIVLVFAIGTISCWICSKEISSVDPARVFGGKFALSENKLPKWITKLKLDSFTKISICGMYRNKKRFFFTVLCNIACLLLTFISISVLVSKTVGVDYVFHNRFQYDVTVCADSEDSLKKAVSLSGVKESELGILFDSTYEDEVIRIEALYENNHLTGIHDASKNVLDIPSNGIILEEGFARRHCLKIGDNITIHNVSLKVQSISREYYDSTQYISIKTAAQFGFSSPNAAFVTLSSHMTTKEYIKKVSRIDGYQYYYDMASRKECALDTLNSIDAPCYLFVAFGILIGVVIVTNMNIITITQRRREYATLSVLGTPKSKFYKISCIEAFWQYLLTILMGIPVSYIVTRILMEKMSSVAQEYVLTQVPLITLISSGAVLCNLIIGILFAGRSIGKLDSISILGEKE